VTVATDTMEAACSPTTPVMEKTEETGPESTRDEKEALDLDSHLLMVLYDVADTCGRQRCAAEEIYTTLLRHWIRSLDQLADCTKAHWRAMGLPLGVYWALRKRLGLPRDGPPTTAYAAPEVVSSLESVGVLAGGRRSCGAEWLERGAAMR